MPQADRFVHFGCPQCAARLKAPKRRAGSRGRCPRCQCAFIVPQESHLPGQAEPDAVHGPDWRPPDEADWPSYIAVRCTLCGTRLAASAEEAGRCIACPDCGTVLTVPQPPLAPRDEHAETYQVRPAIERPSGGPDCPSPEPRRPQPPITESQTQPFAPEQTSRDRTLRKAPASPRLSSTSPRTASQPLGEPLGFLLAPGVRNLWAFLAVGLAVFLSTIGEAARLIRSQNDETVLLGFVLVLFAGLVAVLIFLVGSAYLLALLRETAAGCEQIENWPDNFLDYLLEGLGLVVAALVAAGLSMGLDRLAADAGAPRGVVLGIGTFLLFPLLLLSVLETGLPFMPFSLPIFRSVVAAWPAWMGFYWRAVVLVAIAMGASVCGLMLAGFWAVLPAAALLGAAAILYFRLLGRLASHASQRLADLDARRKPKPRKPPDQPGDEDL